jgi:hypothetical protein
LKRLVLGCLRRLAARSPRLGLLLAELVLVVTRRRRQGIADGQIAALFPRLDAAARRAVSTRTWENFLKGEAAEAAVIGGRYPPLLAGPRLRALRPPLVVASFHVGPFPALGAALAELPGEVLGLDRGQFGAGTGVKVIPGGEDEGARARAFHAALAALRRGDSVCLTVDGQHPDEFAVATIEVPLLGRTLPLARGAFALARLADVPVVPVVARWRGGGVEVEAGKAVEPGRGEEATARAIAAWFEDYLLARPGEITPFLLARLRPAPEGR